MAAPKQLKSVALSGHGVLLEYQHRLRGDAAIGFGWILFGRALAWRERGRPVHDPDAAVQ
jgi:hypothetical protein